MIMNHDDDDDVDYCYQQHELLYYMVIWFSYISLRSY